MRSITRITTLIAGSVVVLASLASYPRFIASRLPSARSKNNPPLTPLEQERENAYSDALRRGILAAERKNYSGAESAFVEALRVKPLSGFTRINLARVYEFEGRDSEAADQYSEALRKSTRAWSSVQTDPRVLARYGDLCLRLGRLSEARLAFGRASVPVVGNFSEARKRRKNLEAIASIADRVNLNGLRASAYEKAGTACLKQGKPAEATLWLKGASALAPSSWTVRQYLGASLSEAGRKAEAAQELHAAESLAPVKDRARVHRIALSLGLADHIVVARISSNGAAQLSTRPATTQDH